MTVVFYAATIILDKFATSIISFPIAGIIGKMSKNIVFAFIVGTFIVYYLYNYLWREFEGGNLPILLIALLILSNLALLNSGKLTPSGSKLSYGQIIGQILFMIFLLFNSDSIRWY